MILTDAFGTRLSAEAIVDALSRLGLDGVVAVEDDGWALEVERPDVRQEEIARALTALRGVLSPLVPLRLRARGDAAAAPGCRLDDRRSRPILLLALAECVADDAPGIVRALADVLHRAGCDGRAPSSAHGPRGGAAAAATSPERPEDAGKIGVVDQLCVAAGRWLAARGLPVDAIRVEGIQPAGLALQRLSLRSRREGASTGVEPVGASEPLAHVVVWSRPGGDRGVRRALLLGASRDAEAVRRLVASLEEGVRGVPGPVDPAGARAADAPDVLLDGLMWRAARRPTFAVQDPRAAPWSVVDGRPAIVVDPERCTACGVCATACPTGYLDAQGRPTTREPSACIRCGECVDACPDDALRPTAGPDTSMLASAAARRPGWLARAMGSPGPALPAPFTPSFLRAKPARTGEDTDHAARDRPARDVRVRGGPADGGDAAGGAPCGGEATGGGATGGEAGGTGATGGGAAGDAARGPRYVLGLATMTMQEHAAVLLRDGEIVGAIELERLVRIRHAGWHPAGRPGVTAAVDPTILLEETLCRRPIRWLLAQAGITLDDLDAIAVNGLHGRFAGSIPFLDERAPVPTVRTGRVVYLPHHLCHAASAYRVSGMERAWVMTADGRGDRESATVFRAEAGALRAVDTLLSLEDRSIGGVYEGVTRLLGFGAHGQGSVMALASFGAPTVPFDEHLGVREPSRAARDGRIERRDADEGDADVGGADAGAGDADAGEAAGRGRPTLVVHEQGLDARYADRRRAPDAPLEARHHDLAASLQHGLERVAIALLARNAGEGPLDGLCLAGGVMLNCRMNERLRRTFRPAAIFAQSGANDAGTALGAALEADTALAPAGFRHPPMTHAYLGPSFDDDAIERAIQRSGLRYRRVADVAEETASLLAAGKVVCWFQGRMEFGPRALGARSILADPRDPAMHARVNAIKQREPWRPFGPSILAGHEEEWLDGGFDARFMLFTLPVRPERRARIPAVVHVDGTTRPQVVHAETAPLYHAMISAFFAKSGVPLVLNTSFNRRGEPIVCTPQDALAAFRGLGADALAIGSFLVDPALETATGEPADGALAALPGGRRLLLRLSTACDLACAHCTLRDLADDRARRGLPAARTTAEALRALREGRQAGCDELVVLRGEAALRDDLPLLVARARAMGYRRVQLQTSGVSLASRARLEPLLGRGGAGGVDAFEVTVLAADEPTHDALSGRPGTLRAQLTALAALTRAGKDVLAVVPVLAGNRARMRAIVALLQRAGVRRLQLSFPRPVELGAGVPEAGLLRLSDAAPAIARAAQVAAEAGMSVSTEGVPHCHLPEALRGAGESAEDFARHRVDDLHLLHDAADLAREEERPTPPPCRRCAARARCPRTWGSYLELHGSDELRPL